jgi:hypothetical protein
MTLNQVRVGTEVQSPKNRHRMIFLLPRNFRPPFWFTRNKRWASPIPRHPRRPVESRIFHRADFEGRLTPPFMLNHNSSTATFRTSFAPYQPSLRPTIRSSDELGRGCHGPRHDRSHEVEGRDAASAATARNGAATRQRGDDTADKDDRQ